MIAEARRRAYLAAMQVASWLPRQVLPFAAPSRPELLEPVDPLVDAPTPTAPVAPPVVTPAQVERPSAPVVPRPALRPERSAAVEPKPEIVPEPAAPLVERQAPPRFALQLYRAGRCLLLVELPTGEPFQSRDPAYLLLKDLLRAAGLPDSPQLIGEPVRWPLLARGNLDQGPQAAREFVQGFVMARLEEQETPPACLWLIGLPALRYAGEVDEADYLRELSVEGLGAAWALPSLELLMDEPARKAELWRGMRRIMGRWQA